MRRPPPPEGVKSLGEPSLACERERERELVVGQWSLVPWFAKTAKLPCPPLQCAL